MQPRLIAVIAHARAGALGRAWQLFREGDFSADSGDASVCTVAGRLLKDSAAEAAAPEERRRLLREAASAYERSAELAPSTYPLINAATLALLGEDPVRSIALAAQVLARVEAEPDEPETPYYRAATRAEALLLLGREEEAKAAFAEAIALAPRAWEDHASTLRQFALILEAQGSDASWLEPHRPPRSIHFGGHMSFAPDVAAREHLDAAIAQVLEEEKVGFGFGALAAGADIIVAEALLARGAELHAVLPGGAEYFAAASVDPFGEAWRRRFDAVLERAETVRAVRPLDTVPDLSMIALGDEVAMGAAAMNARRLESRALRLLVEDCGAPEDGSSAGHGGWRQRVVRAPRERVAPAAPLPAASNPTLAVLAVAAGGEGGLASEARLAEAEAAMAEGPRPQVGPYFTGTHVVLGFESCAEAARSAVALSRTGFSTGGHYGIAPAVSDPFSREARLVGEAVLLAVAAASSAPAGSACVTDDFAAALAASAAPDPAFEYVGELGGRNASPIGLYALKPRL